MENLGLKPENCTGISKSEGLCSQKIPGIPQIFFEEGKSFKESKIAQAAVIQRHSNHLFEINLI